jgi:RNA polymerase sigma factor (sigma-70 family)
LVSRHPAALSKTCIKRACAGSSTIDGERRPYKGIEMPTSPMSEVMRHLRRTVLLGDGAGLTDGRLLEDYLSRRDEAALTALVRRHGPMVWGVCRRVLRNYHDAEDAFQATFLVLVRKAASIASRDLVANWLYGVAHQTALKARATAAKRKGRERQVTEMPEPAATEPDLWRDLQPLLDEELSRLPDRYRAVLVLCDLEGKTRKEAARQLVVPEGSVAGWLARARAMLAKRLVRRGVVLSGGALATVLAQKVAPAGVPTSILGSTIKAVTLVAAGNVVATGMVSVKVAALTEGVPRTMLVNKLKAVMGVLLVAAGCLGGIGAAAGLGRQQDSARKADSEAKQAEAKATAEKAMQERLQGTWKCVSVHCGGVKSEPDLTHTIKGNTWETKLDGRVVQSGTFKLVDLDASPKQIDSVITFAEAEVVGERKGKTCEGIFLLDGDSLFVCASDDADKYPRPKVFFTQEGDGCCAGLFKRIDPKKDR